MKKTIYTLRKSVGLGLLSLLILSASSFAQNISTIAGNGTLGHSGDGSAATLATLNAPTGITFDPSGNLYIAEYSGHYIRKVNNAGTISTIAGTGTASSTGDGSAATSATLNQPTGLAFDASGNLYIAELGGNRIRKINTSGTISTIAGTGTASSTGDGGAATSATINQPTDLAFDASGNLYISESGGNRIRKINTSGIISTIAGTGAASSTGDGSAATSATLNTPAGLVFDASGNLYIAENAGQRVRMINTSGDISTIAGTGTAGSTGDGASATSATIKYPRALAFDASGNLFIATENGSRVRKINTSGIISTFAGTGSYAYSGDGGAANAAAFKTPFSLAFYSGNLYVADLNAYVVRKICNTPRPTLSTPLTYCQGVAAVPLSVTTGSNLLWYTSTTGGTGTTTAPTPSTTSVGSTTYYVSQTPTTFACESPRDSIIVTVNATPLAPNVSTPVTYCEGLAASALTATRAATTDTLYWYTTATGGTGSITAPTPSTSVAGAIPYYVSAKTNLKCEGPRATITVNVNPTPTAPVVTSPITYCQGVSSSALTATKASPTDNLYWYTTATGGTGSTTAPIPSTTSVGTTLYYVSAKTSLGCEGPRSAITVNINPTPAAPVITSPINYCAGASPTVLTATKAATTDVLYWYTTATGGTGSTTAITPSTASVGAANYYVSAKTSLNCEGPRAVIVVNTNAIPSAPSVSSPLNLCKGATAAPLTATKAATNDTLYWYNSAIGGTGSITAPTPSTASLGSTNYYVSAKSVFGCEGLRSLITVEVNPLAAAPTVTSPLSYCMNATASILTATAGATTDTLYWYSVATGGTGTLIAPTPSTTSAGTTAYYVSAKNNYACEGTRSTINVTINPLATKPTVTSPLNYCKGASTVALSATKGAATDALYWYTTATGGTGTTTAPTPSSATVGTQTYYVSAKSSLGCEGLRDSIKIITNALPTTPTVITPLTYCQGVAALPLTATAPSPTDTLYWYTSATGGTGTTTPITPSTATADTTKYYVGVKNMQGCSGSRDSIQVRIIPAPNAPVVTSPLNICLGGPTSTLTATGTDVKWYDAATGGTPSTSAPTPSSSAVGTTNYYVTQTATATTGCESPRANIAVHIRPIPSKPSVVSPLNLCQGIAATALTATKGAATDTLYWYDLAIGGTGTILAPTPTTSATGTTSYYVSQKSIYGCEGVRDTIAVIVNAIPTAPTVSTPLVYCQTIVAPALTATGTNLKWYTAATGGTGSSTAITPSTASAGTTNYYVSQSLASTAGGCESPRATIAVAINPAPTAPTLSSPLNLCEGGSSSALTATGTSLKWYTVATGGTGSTTAPTPSTATSGTTNYYVSQTSAVAAGGCEGARATISVVVNALPAAPTVSSPLNICEAAAGTSLTATGTNLKWYTVATGGTGVATAPSITTGTPGTTVYYVSQSLAAASGGCEGARAAFTVNINPLPSAPIVTTPVNLCIGGASSALTATGTNLKWYAVPTGGTGSSLAPTPSTGVLGTSYYYVSQTSSSSCEGSRSTIAVTVQPLPTVSISSLASSGLIFCKGKTITLKANSATATSYQWSTLGSAITGATDDSLRVGVTGLSGVEVTDVYGCKAKADVYAQQDTSKLPILTPSTITICEESSATLTCSPAFTSYTFNWIKDGTPISPATPKANTKSVSAVGVYSVYVTNNFGCIDTTNDAVVSHYPKIKPVIVNTDPKLEVAKTYLYYQWYRNGAIVSGAKNYLYITSSTGDYFVEVTDANGCIGYSDTVHVETNGINHVIAKTAIKIYPNPTKNIVHIDAPIKVNVSVVDMVGKLIAEEKNVQSVNLENFTDGMYFFRITDENNQLISVEKITKAQSN
jgi:large repetitive protein